MKTCVSFFITSLLFISFTALAKNYEVLGYFVGMNKEQAESKVINDKFKLTDADTEYATYVRETKVKGSTLSEGVIFIWNESRTAVKDVVYAWLPENSEPLTNVNVPEAFSYDAALERAKSKYNDPVTFSDIKEVLIGYVRERVTDTIDACNRSDESASGDRQCADLKGHTVDSYLAKIDKELVAMNSFDLSCEMAEKSGVKNSVVTDSYCVITILTGDTGTAIPVEKGSKNQALFNGFDTLWVEGNEALLLSYKPASLFDKNDSGENYYIAISALDISDTIRLSNADTLSF